MQSTFQPLLKLENVLDVGENIMSNILVQEVDLESAGRWVECRLVECNLMFMQRPVGHKYFSLSDSIGVCPLCTHKKKMENGTIGKKDEDISQFVHHNQAKPGNDTL